MFCESYRETLRAAALNGERLPAEVQGHLTACASCRESFSGQKALFERIGAEIGARVNAEVPASLLPRVRQEIASSHATRTFQVPVFAYVASGLAIGAIALSFAVRSKVPSVTPDPSARVVPSASPNESIVSQSAGGSLGIRIATGKRNGKPRPVAIHTEPEVLVSSEEQLGFQKYVASLRNQGGEVSGVIKVNVVTEIEPLQIASVEVKQLSIQPLESGDAN